MTHELPCDSCDYDGVVCPGTAAHCASGQHCISIDPVCNAEWRNDDHPQQCESCAVVLPTRE